MVDSCRAVKEAIPVKVTVKREGIYFKIRIDYRGHASESHRGSLEDALEWVKATVKADEPRW